MRTSWTLVAVALLGLLASCDGPLAQGIGGDTGTVVLKFLSTKSPAKVLPTLVNVSGVTVKFTSSLYPAKVVNAVGTPDGQGGTLFTATVDALRVGDWHVEAELVDSANVLLYSGRADMYVRHGVNPDVNLTVLASGSVSVDFTEATDLTALAFSTTSGSLPLGVDLDLDALLQFTPANATNQTVDWTSSDPLTATVDTLGRLVAHREGMVSLTATSVDGGFQATYDLTLLPAFVGTWQTHQSGKLVSYVFTTSTWQKIGYTPLLSNLGYPSTNGLQGALTYQADRPADFKLSVDTMFVGGSYVPPPNGVIGEFVVESWSVTGNVLRFSALSRNWGGTRVQQTLYRVNSYVPIVGVDDTTNAVPGDALALAIGDPSSAAHPFDAVSPANATIPDYWWISTDPLVATVDPQTGSVTPNKSGLANVQAYAFDGPVLLKSIAVTVVPVPIDLAQTALTGGNGYITLQWNGFANESYAVQRALDDGQSVWTDLSIDPAQIGFNAGVATYDDTPPDSSVYIYRIKGLGGPGVADTPWVQFNGNAQGVAP